MLSAQKLKGLPRLPLERLIEQAQSHRESPPPLDLTTSIDRSRFFLCPEMTPLYYTDVYRELTVDQARRYNQLTGLAFNELLTFFEEEIGARVLPALMRVRGAPRELVDYLRFFDEEERRHSRMWRALNRLSEPAWYRNRSFYFIRLPRATRRLVFLSCRRPTWFPLYLWIIMAQEELTIASARRLIRAAPIRSGLIGTGSACIEPRYVAAYRAHLQDEIRHVQVDSYLIDHFYKNRSAVLRRFNASLFRLIVREFFLSPTRMAVRVVKVLVKEFPELTPELARMTHQLCELASNRDYQEMLYSRESHPMTFALFDRFPEFHDMRKVFLCYEPQLGQGVGRVG